jgi:hypothetical protein
LSEIGNNVLIFGGDDLLEMTTVYIKSPNMVSRKIAGEIVLVPIGREVGDLTCIYNLNKVGGRIYELIDGGMTVGKIRDMIVEEYEVTPEDAEVDIIEFIEQLEQVGAITAVNPNEST